MSSESAMVLDLLMSLPEELRLLDCTKLQKHLIQVHLAAGSVTPDRATKTFFIFKM